MSPETTMYTPIMDPPSRLPSTIRLDNNSEWYTSALISMAMESVTLPMRLRPHHNFESFLAGDDSIRRIFELQASVVHPEDRDNARQKPAAQFNTVESSEPGSSKVKTEFDVDFTFDSPVTDNSHVFNQLQVLRGAKPDDEDEDSLEEDLGFQRKMRLYNSEPMFHR